LVTKASVADMVMAANAVALQIGCIVENCR
jgi:hypothetical protein